MKLTIENLEKSYGRTKALAGFSYEFTPGIYGILGANGAGKSTLFGLLTDTLRRQSGQILWDGTDILKLGRNYRAKVGYMPQAQGYYPQMSAREFLYYMGEVKGLPRAARKTEAERLLKAVDLWDVADRKLGQFSGGMRQRALLAQAMLGDPELLILDEPTAGVDPRERIRIRGFIAGLARERIVLLATHVVTDVECIADRVLLMNKGRLLKANRPGMLMVMDEAYLFYNPEWQYIQATDSECSIAPMPICTKAECTHSDSSCSAYVELPTYFYSWGDRIYYIQLDDGAGLYSMSMTGEERKQELALSVLDTQAGNISYNCYVGEGYLLLYVWTADLATDAQSCKLYLYDLSDTKAEPVTIYSAQDDSQINYHMYVMDGWAFYSLSSEEQNGALYGYEIATGQTTELVQNWADRNSLTVKDGVLYWCAVNRGIYSVERRAMTINISTSPI